MICNLILNRYLVTPTNRHWRHWSSRTMRSTNVEFIILLEHCKAIMWVHIFLVVSLDPSLMLRCRPLLRCLLARVQLLRHEAIIWSKCWQQTKWRRIAYCFTRSRSALCRSAMWYGSKRSKTPSHCLCRICHRISFILATLVSFLCSNESCTDRMKSYNAMCSSLALLDSLDWS